MNNPLLERLKGMFQIAALQAWYLEKADLSILKGVYLSKPPKIGSHSDKVFFAGGDAVRKPFFESFWNSGAPLIGEEGAAGWLHWAVNNIAKDQHIDLLHVEGRPAASS